VAKPLSEDPAQCQRRPAARDRKAISASTTSRSSTGSNLRTTNVIQSSFATVRHRTLHSKGCLSNKTALAMIFKLAEAAEKRWRRLNGDNQLPKIILTWMPGTRPGMTGPMTAVGITRSY